MTVDNFFIEEQIKKSEAYIPQIESALRETYFSTYDKEFLRTKAGLEDIENNVFRRYDHSLRHVVPWLGKHMDFKGKKVLEIGCGTGSSTAALGHYVQSVDGYDIHSPSIDGARKRLEILGLDNCRLHLVDGGSLLKDIKVNSVGNYDIVLLFAVLEHQTIEERHTTLKECWQLLSKKGIMAVIETPNLLTYHDYHTSELPFLHLLPTRLYAKYAHKSPRVAFRPSFQSEKKMSDVELETVITRWARGVSFHDFELAMGGDYGDYIVAGGFEPEILSWFPSTAEEEVLRWYVKNKNIDIPLAFTRGVLNVLFKKDNPADQCLLVAAANDPQLSDETERILEVEQKYKKTILSIYKSKTWRIGTFILNPIRWCLKFFHINRMNAKEQ